MGVVGGQRTAEILLLAESAPAARVLVLSAVLNMAVCVILRALD